MESLFGGSLGKPLVAYSQELQMIWEQKEVRLSGFYGIEPVLMKLRRWSSWNQVVLTTGIWLMWLSCLLFVIQSCGGWSVWYTINHFSIHKSFTVFILIESVDHVVFPLHDRGANLHIRSVISLDHFKNYIYIEADKQAHVREVSLLIQFNRGCRNMWLKYQLIILVFRPQK